MADKYVNATGVQTIKTWIEGKFALDTDLASLDAKVDEIISEGGEPNVIESISVNGTEVTPDAQKNVELTVPTATSGLTNDGDGTSKFATETYVQTNGGKIDKIQVNGTDQTIANKTVNITVPTKVSDLTNDNNYQTASDVQSAIESGVASAVKIKGSVANYAALPTTGNSNGDMYDTLDTGKNYVWIYDESTQTGRWDDYAGTIDMSAFWTSTAGQANTLEAMTVAEINAILEPSA